MICNGKRHTVCELESMRTSIHIIIIIIVKVRQQTQIESLTTLKMSCHTPMTTAMFLGPPQLMLGHADLY